MGIFNFFKLKNTRVKPGDIMKTTDGFFARDKANKKPRHVVVYDKRKDDGALAISKIHTKETQKPGNYIENLDLKPNRHSSLKNVSVIEKRVVFGIKDSNNNHKAIYASDLQKTKDKLNCVERRKHLRGAGGDTPKNKETLKNTTKKWKEHFTNKKAAPPNGWCGLERYVDVPA